MRLFRAKGRVWYLRPALENVLDSDGRMSLISLRDNSAGLSALPSESKEITGSEYEEQMDATKWFIKEGVIPNYCGLVQ